MKYKQRLGANIASNPYRNGASRITVKQANFGSRSRVQDYIKTRNVTWENEQSNQLMRNLFTCLVNGTLYNYGESLKKDKIFGIISKDFILKRFQRLIDKTDFISFYEDFLNLVKSVLGNNSGGLVSEAQAFDFSLLRKIMHDAWKNFADDAPDDAKGFMLKQILNVIKMFMHRGKFSAEEKTSFNSSINFLLDYLIDNTKGSEEDKIAKKKAIKAAINIALPAMFKVISGEKLTMSPEDRNHLLRSILTILASYDSSLYRQVEQYLSRNPTNKELETQSQCLMLFVLRKTFEYVMDTYDAADLSSNEYGPIKCGINGIKDGFRMMLAYIPEDLTDIGCEGFDTNAAPAAQGRIVASLG